MTFGTQFTAYLVDLRRHTGSRYYRYLYVWLSPALIGLGYYRLERGLYLWFGRAFDVIHPVFLPINWLIQLYSRCDIHYQANLGKGVLILHTVHGIVISGLADVGPKLTLAGGNVIGERREINRGELNIGDHVFMGMHAQVLGPVKIGDGAQLAAGAVVVKDVPAGKTAF